MSSFTAGLQGVGQYGMTPGMTKAQDPRDQWLLDYVDTVQRQIHDPRDDRIYRSREFYDGRSHRHWMDWDDGQAAMALRNVPSWRWRFTSHVLTTSALQIANIVASTPVGFYGTPENNTTSARQRASVATKFIRSISSGIDMDMRRYDAVLTAAVDGAIVVAPRWNGQTGQSTIDVRPLWEFGCDPGSTSFDKANIVWSETWELLDRVKAEWPGNRALARVTAHQEDMPVRIRRRLAAAEGRVTFVDDGVFKGYVRRLEVWIRPTKKNPQGIYLVFVGRERIYRGPLPYIDAGVEIPFETVSFIPKPGMRWGMSLSDLAQPKIRYYEKLMSTVGEANALMARPHIIIGRTAKAEMFNTQPGGVWRWDAEAREPKPEYAKGPLVEGTYYQLMSILQEEILDSLGVRQATRGNLPARIDSGRAVLALQASDKGQLSMFSAMLNAAFGRALMTCVKLERTYGEGERTAKVVGRNNVAEIAAFDNATLDAVGGIHVVNSQTLGFNPMFQQQMIIELVTAGLLDPEEARNLLPGLPTVPGEQVTERALNEINARNENEKLLAGEFVVPSDLEMHSVHMYEHRMRWLEEKEDLDPETEGMLLEHIRWHRILEAGAQMGAGQLGIAPQAVMNPAAAAGMGKPGGKNLTSGSEQQQPQLTEKEKADGGQSTDGAAEGIDAGGAAAGGDV